MPSWYDNYKPKLQIGSHNNYGELEVFIWDDKGGYKPYHYLNVFEPTVNELERLLKHKNYSKAFQMINRFKLDPYFHKQKEQQKEAIPQQDQMVLPFPR